MRLLLDESLPRGLKNLLKTHEVATVQERGWAGASNGKLLRLAALEFDVFVTADQNLEYQQNLVGFDIAVIVLAAASTRIPDLEPLIPKVLAIIPDLISGEVRRIAV